MGTRHGGALLVVGVVAALAFAPAAEARSDRARALADASSFLTQQYRITKSYQGHRVVAAQATSARMTTALALAAGDRQAQERALAAAADELRPPLLAFNAVQRASLRRWLKRGSAARSRLSPLRRDALAVRMNRYITDLQLAYMANVGGVLSGVISEQIPRPPALGLTMPAPPGIHPDRHVHVVVGREAVTERGPGAAAARSSAPVAKAAQETPGTCVDTNVVNELRPGMIYIEAADEAVRVCVDTATTEVLIVTAAPPGVAPSEADPTVELGPAGGDVVAVNALLSTTVDDLCVFVTGFPCNPASGANVHAAAAAPPVFVCSVFMSSNYYPLEHRDDTKIEWGTREVCPPANAEGGTLLRPRGSTSPLAAGNSYKCKAGPGSSNCTKSRGGYLSPGQRKKKYSLDLCSTKTLVKPFGPWVNVPLAFGVSTRKCSGYGTQTLFCVFTRLFSAPAG